MDVEREVLDLYRALYMRDRIGDVMEGTVTAITGGGLYVTLDDPFVDVLVRYESLGPDHYRTDDDDLGVRGERSGDRVSLGDRLTVTIEDVALQRRTVLARRVLPEKVLASLERGGRAPAPRDQRTPPDRGRGSKHSRHESPNRGRKPPDRGQRAPAEAGPRGKKASAKVASRPQKSSAPREGGGQQRRRKRR
jgi:ribonuclease R